MDELREFSQRCRAALDADDAESLKKYLLKLKQKIDPDEYRDDFIPKLLLKSVRDRKTDCFSYVLSENTNFSTVFAQESFAELFRQGQQALILSFLQQCRQHTDEKTYKIFAHDLFLDHAVKAGNTALMDTAVKNGANIHRKKWQNLSHYLHLAMESNQPKALAWLLENKVKAEVDAYDIGSLIAHSGMKYPVICLELLFEHGYLRPSMDVRNEILDPMGRGYGMYAPKTDPQAERDIQNLFLKWQRRHEYRNFIATFKPIASVSDLRLSYESHGIKQSCFHGLAMADRFDEAVKIALQGGEKIRPDDLFSRNSNGNRVIDILGARKKLGILDNVGLWADNPKEYFEVLKAVPAIYRNQMNPAHMRGEFLAERVKKISKTVALPRRRPKP